MSTGMLQILLNPDTQNPEQLRQIYDRAFWEAQELYVASAYLTDWKGYRHVNPGCRQVIFLVGTDFGLTRKAAMRDVLRWLPKRACCIFGAVPRLLQGGFHPKVVAWRDRTGRHFCVVGSSNLSRAGFASNYEANVFLPISAREFGRVTAWLDSIAQHAVPVTGDWINHHYKEALPPRGGKVGARAALAVKLHTPEGVVYARVVRERRGQQAAFKEISHRLRTTAIRCADGEITNNEFWRRFWRLWSSHASRFQGSGLEFTGKSANWRQVCGALVRILDAAKRRSITHLDYVVSREIDRLVKAQNPARGAWLSEMLCHYFPELYPIRNEPVRRWLSWNKWRGRRGATEGQRYIELARQLRHAVRARPAGARNLAELDLAIWQWTYNRGL